MPWTRLDDQFHTNPKLTALSDAAFRLYVNGLVWSVANLTDGRISFVNASQTLGNPHGNSVRNAIRYLVEERLWEPDADEPDVWWVHHFDQYQPTKAQIEQEREATRRRVAKHRDRRGNGVTDPLRNGVTEDDVTALVTPPHPNPSLSIPLSSPTHTLTDTLNGDPEMDDGATDWTEPPKGLEPFRWDNAVAITQHAGEETTIHNPHAYTKAVYQQLTQTADDTEHNTRALTAITNCDECTDAGWTTDSHGDIIIPTIRCTHLHAVKEAEA